MPTAPRAKLGPAASALPRRVIELPIREDAALVAALQAGRLEARKALFDRHAQDIERILYRVLGPDSESMDLLQDVFVVALDSIDQLRDPHALSSWLRGIAVRKARKLILRRQRWRFVRLFAPSDLPEREALLPTAEHSEALRVTYSVLDELAADERVAFSLRFIDGMELTEVASACGVSLATIKRRLARAQHAFMSRAAQRPALAEWLAGDEP